jgi:Ca-activated chloride channel homolog
MLRFDSPYWLILLIIPVVSFIFFLKRKKGAEPAVIFSYTEVFKIIGTGRGKLKRYLPLIISLIGVIILIFAMARPQAGRKFHERSTYGIDIILAMDISSSMSAMDFNPLTRFEAAREVVKEFIDTRKSDRIGLVAFAAQSFTLCPLTLDYYILSSFLENAWYSRLDDGTAIGLAIATSVNRLRNSDAKSRIIILLTDGMNNSGNLDPLSAARLAEALKIRIYTIGVGTEGRAPMIVDGRTLWTETHIDEKSLTEVASITGGKYYRATNKDELKGIYDEIGKLETSRIKYNEWIEYNELYAKFLYIGFALLLFSFLLEKLFLRRMP